MGQAMESASRVPAAVTFAARLSFEDIRHSYDGTQTLRGLSLVAEPGQVTCLLGPSGSGKTTLLRIASGIEPQASGRILLNDREIAGPSVFLPPEKRSIGLVFQDFALFPHLTILQNVKFGLTALSPAEADREARIALSRVGLEHYADAWPHLLSGGEQQRVALARAIAPRPAVLLMDEPFSGLDSRLKDTVRAETLDILRQSRTTAIVVTHDAEEAMRMGDRIALLKDGRLVQAGTAEEIYYKPVNLFAAGFFAEMNLFRATVGDGEVATPLGIFQAGDLGDGTPVTVAIRLAGIEVDESDGSIPARVLSRRFLGIAEIIDLAIPGADKPVRARIRHGTLAPGRREFSVSVRKSDVLVFESGSENA